ncbi:MAG: DUF4397 domain-containing protein [Hungatella sp.]|nr:DUF4397 domain-containing protein [Hungatella sp.]
MAVNTLNQQLTPSAAPDMKVAQTDPNVSSAHLTDADYGLDTPAATEEGTPAASGNSGSNNNYGISTPNYTEGGIPAYPGNDNNYGINTPNYTEGGIPAYPGNNNNVTILPSFPSFPSFCPSCPSTSYGQVRFLNASTNNFSINITVDSTTYASNISFGTITGYSTISDGFHTITVRRSTGLRAMLVQQTFPFSANERYTMVLVDSAQGGVNLIQVPSTSCSNISSNIGCYRVANMAYSGSNFDVMLYSHDAVFRNVGFEDVTAYKQAAAGSYQFYITNAANFTVIRELPALVIGAVVTGTFTSEPLVSYQVDISGRSKYTSYLIGNTWSGSNFRVLTVED